MNNHTLDILEYPEALAQIADYGHGTLVQNRLQSLHPCKQERDLGPRQLFNSEVLQVYTEAGDECPVLEPVDLSEIITRVRPAGAVLGDDDLCKCRESLHHARRLAQFLRRKDWQRYSSISKICNAIRPQEDLRKRLDATFDEDGVLLDNASPELARIRKQIGGVENDIRRRLNGLLRDSNLKTVLQDNYVTVRNRRYVLPVKRDVQAKLSGVVHDHSDSGQTLFIEPASILPLGNALSDLYADYDDECRRIRAALSDHIRQHYQDLAANQEAVVAFSVALAVARWAVEYECVIPEFDAAMDLRNARHPLLQEKLAADAEDENQLVPLDLRLSSDCKALVITGSNSGGKTVAMKTAGLLTLLAQSGLPAPVAEGSRFVFFQNIFADIGDEQSLTENLSTFTGHMQRVGEICRAVENSEEGKALIILDELGTGTDPLEGGALACAILERLVDADCLTLATTHLGVVKTFVHENPVMVNASVRFNTETLEPEYAVKIGQPGASHALNIAKRAGLPISILDKAGKFMGTDEFRLEQLLDELEEKRRQAVEQNEQARNSLAEATRNREELEAELKELKRERRSVIHEAYEEAGRIIEETRRRTERLIAGLQNSDPELRNEAGKKAKKEVEAHATTVEEKRRETKLRPVRPLAREQLVPGCEVWVQKLQTNGLLASIGGNGKRARVKVGQLEFEVPTDELGKPQKSDDKPKPNEPRVSVSRPKAGKKVSNEINLIGTRVAEALPRLEQFLDEAMLAGLEEIRVVHGFGTGQLQKAVHEYLKSVSFVRDFQLGDAEKDPGGGGVTKVILK
ncbi:MAG: endonuclease MutS2 [Lentisphaeria bacterium]